MNFPGLRAYMAAIADIQNINIPFFQSSSMQIFLNRRGVPYMSVGGFGVVFRFKDKHDRQYGLKCFTRESPGRAERYRALHDTLQITKFPFMVDFQYVQDGIRVGENQFPVVVMEWGAGLPLDDAIESDMEDGTFDNAARFAGNLFQLVKTLQDWKMGHGDLQEGNLLVDDQDRITLIDYDGMFVPALEGQGAGEIGLADYQHPRRTENHFGPTIDDFSLLSILYQLAVIKPELWKSHHDDKRLLLRQADYNAVSKSEILKRGSKSDEPHVKALAALLKDALKKDPLAIDAVRSVQAEATIVNWLQLSGDTTIRSNFTSIISRVVSLSNDEVRAFEENRLELAPGTAESNAAGEPVAHPGRAREAGVWGLAGGIKRGLIDLFFEEVNPAESSDEDASPGTGLARIKKGVWDLFFEEVPDDAGEEQTTAGPLADPSASVAQTTGEAPVSPPAPQDHRTAAPVPEWMKNRKRS